MKPGIKRMKDIWLAFHHTYMWGVRTFERTGGILKDLLMFPQRLH